MNTLRILGLDDDNHAPMFRCEDGTLFETPKELIEFLAKPHDCEVRVRMFAIVDPFEGPAADLDEELVDKMFQTIEGIASYEGVFVKDSFETLWLSANRRHW